MASSIKGRRSRSGQGRDARAVALALPLFFFAEAVCDTRLAGPRQQLDLIRSTTIIPIARSQLLLLTGSAALPFAPLILLAFPLGQLIIDSFKAVLNV